MLLSRRPHLCGTATETAKDARKRAGELADVVWFAFATGWRTTSEVLPLQWRHVDWAGRCVRLDAHTTKNGEARSFPFTVDIEKVLTAQLAIHEELKAAGRICPFVFYRNGERIGYFRAAWQNACKAAGCPGALVHDMRRSAVRTFERAGVPRSVALSIVGHKTESIYRRYAIVDEAMQREAAARLDAWMAAPPAAPSTATVTSLRRSSRLRDRVTGPAIRHTCWAGIDAQCGVSRDLALIVPESWVPPKENDISILRRGHAAQPAEGLSATYSARSAMTGSTRVARRVGT